MKSRSVKKRIDTDEAILLAAMLHQSYRLFEQEAVILPEGYVLRSIIEANAGVEEPEAERFGFIAESDTAIIVVFRGTRTFKDNESDQDLHQVPYPFVHNTGFTHRGFTCIYQSTRNAIIRELYRLPSAKKLFVAGHSLGGGLAVLAGLDIAVNTLFKEPIVYTYGSPRAGDPTFAAHYDRVVKNSIRIANIHDIIPTLPDTVYPPPFTKNGLVYKHVKQRYPLSFQLNSLAIRNHEIACYFKFLSEQRPHYTNELCRRTPGFCPSTDMCVPFKGTCSPV